MILEVSSAVWYDSLTRRSRPSLVSAEARTNVPDRGPGGEASHALELDKSAPTDYARLPSFSGCLVQPEFCLAFRGMMPDRTLTTREAFSPLAPVQALSWTRPHADLC
jgi:hypothetical protein